MDASLLAVKHGDNVACEFHCEIEARGSSHLSFKSVGVSFLHVASIKTCQCVSVDR